MKEISYKQSQYIVKIYETGNITKTAKELYITQPALSHFLAKIEQEIGSPLFFRNTMPLKPTPEGEAYIKAAKQIMEIIAQFNQDLDSLEHKQRGIIRVGMSHARAGFFLPRLIPEFKKKHPEAEIVITANGYLKGETDIRDNKTDFAVMPLSVATENFSTKLIMRDELLAVSHESLVCKISEKTGDKYISPDYFQHRKLIVPQKGQGLRRAIDSFMADHEVEPYYILETSGNENIYRLASAGMGLAIVPRSIIETIKSDNPPFTYAIGSTGINWDIVAVFEDWNTLGSLQKELILLMRELFLDSLAV